MSLPVGVLLQSLPQLHCNVQWSVVDASNHNQAPRHKPIIQVFRRSIYSWCCWGKWSWSSLFVSCRCVLYVCGTNPWRHRWSKWSEFPWRRPIRSRLCSVVRVLSDVWSGCRKRCWGSALLIHDEMAHFLHIKLMYDFFCGLISLLFLVLKHEFHNHLRDSYWS